MARRKNCQHEWRWVQPVIHPYAPHDRGRAGRERESHNAECDRCGTTVWAHGRMPYFPSPWLTIEVSR